MLVVLPRTNKHVYAIDLERITTVLIINADKRNKLYRKLLEREAQHLPVINKYRYISAHKVKLPSGKQRVREISAFILKRRLLEIAYPFIIEEPEEHCPRRMFEILSSINYHLHTYYTITYTKVYAAGSEATNYKTRRFIVVGPAVIFL